MVVDVCLSLDEMLTLAEGIKKWKLDIDHISTSYGRIRGKNSILRGENGRITIILNSAGLDKDGDNMLDKDWNFIEVFTHVGGQKIELGGALGYGHARFPEELKRFTRLYHSVYDSAKKAYDQNRTEALDSARTILHRD